MRTDSLTSKDTSDLTDDTHALLVRLVDLAETEGASKKPTKAMEFSPQVTQFFNIMGFLEIFRSFYGIFRGEIGDF